MIKHFIKKELAVKDCCTYTAVRDADHDTADIIEYYNVTKNFTDPAMQQVNVSRSKKNAIRGVHISGFPKVVFCPVGRIYDLVIDMRPESPTFKKWCGAWLDKDTHIICPEFCAHGVFSAEEDSVICYYQGGTFFNHLDYAVNWKDPSLKVEWPKPIDSDDYIMSEKDLTSSFVSDELIEKIRARIKDPIKHMHEVTNSDVVVITTNIANSKKYLEEIANQKLTRGHLLQMNALNRESLKAALVSLRSQYGVIYQITCQKEGLTSILTEALNIIHICAELDQQLVIVAENNLPGIEIIKDIIEKERAGKAVLHIEGDVKSTVDYLTKANLY